MLTTSRKQIVEKVIANADGVLFRVWFLVSYENGKCVAKAIKAIQLGSIEENSVALALPSPKTKNVFNFDLKVSSYENILSPYSSLLFVTGSKPRAPTK